ncbi:MAG TPA: hypothetical protein VHM23_09985 [Actinomycetota bacterium]|jgi:hypothetical protein|nr:hypothetical protein [Actinomycetota bacterium]
MSASNGHGDIGQLENAGETRLADGKIRLDADLLTPRDMRRARVALDGRNPFELLDDPIDRVVLVVWCLVSRDDPSFTWEQAEDVPFSRLDTGSDEPDPPTAAPGSPGRGDGPPAAKRSSGKRRGAAPAPS